MSWKKHFRTIKSNSLNSINYQSSSEGSPVTSSKISSYLPEVFAGHPSRIQRYYAFDDCDRDSDINAALDTIADFCTQSEEQSDDPFDIIYNEEANETEVTLIKSNLKLWVKLNDFKKRLWHIFRGTIKNGDSFFLVDPETYEWLWVDHFSVEMVKVDETKGKEPDEYIIRGLDINRQAKFATRGVDPSQYKTPFGTSLVPNARPQGNPGGASTTNNAFQLQGSNRDLRQQVGQKVNELSVIDAQHMVHLSLSVGMDVNWPFGSSILEPIFKTFKQKELLEDSILIYRVMRAPERRVFKIDVGSMPPIRAKAHIEMIKNEIHQRRIPNRCLSLKTNIYLLDGRLIPLSQIITEHNEGKQNWVYSCDPDTGKIVPGKITWAGNTKSQTKVLRLTLDNGKTITCTPDHKFPILGKGFVEAQNLEIGESFIPLYTQENKYSDKKSKYIQIFDNAEKKWKYVHRVVAEYFRDTIVGEKVHCEQYKTELKQTVHHLNFDRYNNNPENLCWMNAKDHIIFHGETGSDAAKNYWKNLKYNIQAFDERIKKLTIQNKIFWKTPEGQDILVKRKIVYDKTLFDMSKLILASSTLTNPRMSWRQSAKELNNNVEFMTYYKKLNPHINSGVKQLDNFTLNHLKFMVKSHGYKSWQDFKKDFTNIDYSLYRFNQKLYDIVLQKYMNSSASTMRKLIAELKINPEWNKEFDLVHVNNPTSRKLFVCDRYIYELLKWVGYKNWRDFCNKNPNQKFLGNRNSCVKYNFNHEMFNILRNHYTEVEKNLPFNKHEVGFIYKSMQKDEKFIKLFQDTNNSKKNKFGPDLIKTMIKNNGFSSYSDFKNKQSLLNHKLVKMEWCEELEDTGTITVDGREEFHNFHTFAIEGGIFTKNSGTGGSIIDAAYNPLAICDDYFFAVGLEGRGSSVEVLPGGDNLGEIGDLSWFAKKMARGLRIPTSYLSLGDEETGSQGAGYNDGKLGAAVIQEFRFNKYCMRLQALLSPNFDQKFKEFLKGNGIEIESNLFELRFNPPQNFTKYRQIELDSQQVSVYQQVAENKKLSERFKLKRFLNLTEDEILENERMWAEENADKLKKVTGETPADSNPEGDLGDVGFHMPEGGMGDMDEFGGEDMGGEEGGPPPEGGQAPGPGAGPAAPPPAGGQAPPM